MANAREKALGCLFNCFACTITKTRILVGYTNILFLPWRNRGYRTIVCDSHGLQSVASCKRRGKLANEKWAMGKNKYHECKSTYTHSVKSINMMTIKIRFIANDRVRSPDWFSKVWSLLIRRFLVFKFLTFGRNSYAKKSQTKSENVIFY